MDIKEYIKNQRPNLSQSSINTYNSILKNLYKNVYDNEDYEYKNFNDTKKILNYLKDLPHNKRKTILSALVVLTNNETYRKHMLDDIQDFNNEIQKQEKTETQKENWVQTEEIKNLFDEMHKEFKYLVNKKNFVPEDYQEIQKFIILALYSGIFIPPRRSKDYVDFKIRKIKQNEDNFMWGNKFIFNTYKTSKTYGQQYVDIPRQLKLIIAKWSMINPTDYLLFDINGNQLSSVKLNQRLNKIFDGKKIGVNALRHEYLTNKYKDVSDKLDSIDKDFKDMGSSRIQFKTYVKKD